MTFSCWANNLRRKKTHSDDSEVCLTTSHDDDDDDDDDDETNEGDSDIDDTCHGHVDKHADNHNDHRHHDYVRCHVLIIKVRDIMRVPK